MRVPTRHTIVEKLHLNRYFPIRLSSLDAWFACYVNYAIPIACKIQIGIHPSNFCWSYCSQIDQIPSEMINHAPFVSSQFVHFYHWLYTAWKHWLELLLPSVCLTQLKLKLESSTLSKLPCHNVLQWTFYFLLYLLIYCFLLLTLSG